MIRRIQALNFRCLRYTDLQLDRFHVLIGPNASGKSTLFDAISFLGDLVRDGLDSAIGTRTANFQDLVWNRPVGAAGFELAVEVDIPAKLRLLLPPDKDFKVFRYEIAIRNDDSVSRISSERALLMPSSLRKKPPQRALFPYPPPAPETILLGRGRAGMRSVVSKSDQGTDSYYVETAPRAGKGWVTSISFGPRRLVPLAETSRSDRTPLRSISPAAGSTPFVSIPPPDPIVQLSASPYSIIFLPSCLAHVGKEGYRVTRHRLLDRLLQRGAPALVVRRADAGEAYREGAEAT